MRKTVRSNKKGIRKHKKLSHLKRSHRKHKNASSQEAGRVLHALGRFKTPRRTRKNNDLHKLERQMRVTHYSI
jgi:hypothetical protein